MDVNKVLNGLEYLCPVLRLKVIYMQEQIKLLSLPVAVFETGRTRERQEYIMKQGFTRTLQSKHLINVSDNNLSLAVDFVYYDEKGWSWDYENHEHEYETLGMIGKHQGLVWGADWKTFTDYPHFQLTQADIDINNKYFRDV